MQLIPTVDLPKPTPRGLWEECSRALTQAGLPSQVAVSPLGLECADAGVVRAVMASYANSEANLKAARTAKLKELEKSYETKIEEGFSFNGHVFQIDAASQFNISAMGTRAALVLSDIPGSLPWPEGFSWVTKDNQRVRLDAAGMYALAQATANYVSALILAKRAHKDALLAGKTEAEVLAVSFADGWPPNK